MNGVDPGIAQNNGTASNSSLSAMKIGVNIQEKVNKDISTFISELTQYSLLSILRIS